MVVLEGVGEVEGGDVEVVGEVHGGAGAAAVDLAVLGEGQGDEEGGAGRVGRVGTEDHVHVARGEVVEEGLGAGLVEAAGLGEGDRVGGGRVEDGGVEGGSGVDGLDVAFGLFEALGGRAETAGEEGGVGEVDFGVATAESGTGFEGGVGTRGGAEAAGVAGFGELGAEAGGEIHEGRGKIARAGAGVVSGRGWGGEGNVEAEVGDEIVDEGGDTGHGVLLERG
jgi:hypothetical protein